MRLLTVILLAILFFATPAQASNEEIQFGPIPDWVSVSPLMEVPDDASGLVFVRRQDILIRLLEQKQLHYSGSRLKILHSNALQIGNISIAWKPRSGSPTVHAIKVYRDGEVIDNTANISFEILRREDQLEAAMLDGVLTAVARIPDLRVGDELELAYTIPVSEPTLGNSGAGIMFLQTNPSSGRFRLGLNWEDGQKTNIQFTDDLSDAIQKSENSVDINFDNPENLPPPKDAPPRFSWQRILEFSDFANWNDISARFSELYVSASKLEDDSPLKKEASRIAAMHQNDFDRAQAALKLVQQNVRYIYVGLDRGNLEPANADDTWKRRYGDCKGKTALLLALLAELGISAEVVLANNAGGDDGLNDRLPSPGLFDHVLVRAILGGKNYFLDGTLPAVIPPTINPVYPYRWILPLTNTGASLEERPWQPFSEPYEISLFEIDARAGFNKPAVKKSTTIKRGIVGLGQQVQFSGLAPGQLLSVMRQSLIGDTWQEISDVRWKFDEKAQASVLTIEGTGMVDWDNDGGGSKSLSLPGGGFNPPSKRIRATIQDQSVPYYNKPNFTCHVTTVRFPNDTKTEQWSHNAGFNTLLFGRNFYRTFAIHDGAIRMIRSSRTEQVEIDANVAQQDNQRISAFNNSKGVIYFDPDSINLVKPTRKKVPATYDLEWASDSSACLFNSVED